MINWILQKNLTKSGIRTRIKNALIQPDETWEEIEMIPFSATIPPIKNENSFHIVYGSTTLMLNALKDDRFKSGVFYDPTTFNMQNYVNRWQQHVLNSKGKLVTLDTLRDVRCPNAKKWFVRPNHDSKEFSGQVDTFEQLKHWTEKIIDLDLPDFNEDTELWIAEPQPIEKEWRLFIVNDVIVSASRYMLHGELNESPTDIPEGMLAFAKARIRQYRLAEVYVMDVAEVKSKYKIIECNCFNGTGFYSHDIEAIVKAVNEFVRSAGLENQDSQD